jgi:uncharacterized pyridoxamine 5'-phosphate oxidase family protein
VKKVLYFLKDNPTFYFATVDGDKPRIRPFGFFMEYEGKLYFATGKHKACYQQIKANPNVEICTANADNTWIRIRGQAVFDDRAQTVAKVFEERPYLRDYYKDQNGKQLCAFYLRHGYAEIADKTGCFETIRF